MAISHPFACLLATLLWASSQAKIVPKIVGGHPIAIEEAPHQASYSIWGFHICGGSVISENLVVSAAHCVAYDIHDDPFGEISVGSAHLDEDRIYYQIAEILVHPEYDPWVSDNDISLLRIAGHIEFGDTVQPIPLVEQDLVIEDGEPVDVTGWGNLEEGGPSPDILHKVTVPIVEEEKCRDAYAGIADVTSTMLCAGVEEGGLDACQGDSGSGLTYEGQLAGIVSWGFGCARPSYPGVYARVAAVRDWVDEAGADKKIRVKTPKNRTIFSTLMALKSLGKKGMPHRQPKLLRRVPKKV